MKSGFEENPTKLKTNYDVINRIIGSNFDYET